MIRAITVSLFLVACGGNDPGKGGEPVGPGTGTTDGGYVPPPLGVDLLAEDDVPVFVDAISTRCEAGAAFIALDRVGEGDVVELDLVGDVVTPLQLTPVPSAPGAIWHRFEASGECLEGQVTVIARAFRDGVERDCVVKGPNATAVLEGGRDEALRAAGRPDASGCRSTQASPRG